MTINTFKPIKSKKDLIYYIDKDKKQLNIHSRSFFSELFFPNNILKFQITLRKLEYYHNNERNFIRLIKKTLVLFKYRRLSEKLSFSIPVNTVGPGLSIAHYGPIIINTKTKIGANCRIHVGVNIGEVNGLAPVIGDNCYIGPGAKIFGNIKIGNNVKIGANAVVNKSFNQNNISIAGIPSKIIKNNN
ncbi:serine acetyltransferase [Tamlana haliotis]|uniref:Serine acetyltransferase n=1 Tax=Pseudotamlana haliotis TaxID=2614804 RepID=A0A6N6MBC2_9FLAO|nr:DapH/DapD/GlmU-related protein [Tamlana haliotis]KAB1067860.1 serine acetyltransferase [Tamlana haliotis]